MVKEPKAVIAKTEYRLERTKSRDFLRFNLCFVFVTPWTIGLFHRVVESLARLRPYAHSLRVWVYDYALINSHREESMIKCSKVPRDVLNKYLIMTKLKPETLGGVNLVF